MANRFPLVLDTTDNNKIKEIQAGDNLNLTDNSITGVQNITALGTIDAADITVRGNKLVAQAFADLTDTPDSFVGSPNYFVKVKADGTGLEYRPLSDLGNIEIDTITVDNRIVPSVDNIGYVGTEAFKFNQIVASRLKGSLVSFNDEIVFDAVSGKISYAALQGAPDRLSNFTDDIGFLRTADLNSTIAGLFDDGVPFETDIKGSVFADDSTILVDGTAGKIVGDIDFGETPGFIEGDEIVILPTDGNAVSIGTARLLDTLTPENAQGGAIGTEELPFNEANFVTVNTDNISTDIVNLSEAIGVAQLTASTDLVLNAGNRVKIDSGVPFRFSSATATEQLAIGAEEGDVIYNTTTNRLQMYQGSAWKDINGNVEATAGTSNFNDVVVAGNLTVSGTTTTVDTENTTISDNVIVLNDGEVGAGVTATTAGIEIDRGTSPNRSLVWTENFGGKWLVTDDATLLANRLEANYLVGSLSVSTDDLVMTDGNVTATGTLTMGGNGLVQIVSVTTDIELLPVGKVKIDGNLEVTGTFDGDVTGSVFGDDSTVLVDAVNNKVTGEVDNAEVITTTVQGRDSLALNIYRGVGGTVSLGDASSGDVTVGDSGINITSTAGVDINGAATGTVNIGTSATTGNVTIGKAGNTTTINGTFNAALTGNVTGNVTGDVTGNVTGNIDNTALTIGSTTATTIAIGNVSSTTTITGNLALTDALIVNDLTSDDSITIQTNGNSAGESISLQPTGSDTEINLTSDFISINGIVTTPLITQGGIVGDVKGSVVGDDSTVLIDGISGTIVGPIDSTTISGSTITATTEIKSSTINNLDTTDDMTVSAVGFMNINGGTGSGAGLSTIQIDQVGINYVEIKTEPNNPASPTDYARIAINAGTNEGDVRIGTPTSTRGQIVEIYNATVNGTLVGSAQGNHTGTLTGDVVGSVFADDSTPIIDASNRTMFSDLLTLAPLSVEPTNPAAGQLAVADGTGWDPSAGASVGKQQTVIYLGSAWVQIAVEA